MRHTTTTAHAVRAVLLLALAGCALLLLAQPARAQVTEVRLTGNDANNFFIIRAISATDLQFCSDTVACFSRPRADLQRIAIDGFDGDDGLFISHGGWFVGGVSTPLSVTFDGGVGSDELRICTIDTGCVAAMTTDVSFLPEIDELRVVQCLDRQVGGARCLDEPFQQAVPTLKVNARGLDVLTDISTGPATVIGTPAADTVALDGGETFRNTRTGQNEVTGRVSVANLATVQVLNKDNLTLDTGAGADAITVGTRHGLLPQIETTPCARDGAAVGAPVCVYAGTEQGDTLEVASGGAEAVSLTTRPSDTARLAGLDGPPVIDLAGVDALTIPTQPAQGDSFTLYGSPIADAFAWDAATTDLMTISGHLATTTSIPAPIPTIALRSDGTGPIRATLDALDGADVITMRSGPSADDITLSGAAGAFGVTATHLVGDLPHSAVTANAERLDLVTGDGADAVHAPGGLAPDIHWQAGAGPDVLHLTGGGTPVVADLGSRRAWEGPLDAVGVGVTATEAETWAVDAAGSSLTVRGGDAADTMRYAPADGTSATTTIDGGSTRVDATGVGGTMSLDPAGGDDVVAIDATTGADPIAVGRGARTTVQVGESLPARATGATEGVVIDGRTGDDRFLISGDGGAATITVVGGGHTGGDRLSFAAAVSSAILTFDAAPAAGVLDAGGPPVAFRDLEHVDVEGDEAGTFTVRGSDAADTIVQAGQTITAGRGTTASFTRYPTLALDGMAGDDDLVLAPRTLAGVADIRVDGGDAGTDTATVIGTALRETIAFLPDGPTSSRVEVSLAPPITLGGIEAVEVDGRTAAPSGDTAFVSSPAVGGTVVVTPGGAADAATVTMADAAVPALHLGGLGRGSIVVDGAGDAGHRADTLRVVGQPDADVVVVTAAGGGSSTVLDTRVPVVTAAVPTIELHGLDGADTFRIPLAHDLVGTDGPAIVVDAGSPGGGDVAVLTGSGGALTTDLAARTVAQDGHRPVGLTGLDRIDLLGAGAHATVLAGSGPDALTARPTAAGAAQVTSDLLATRLDVVDVTGLLLDGRGGADTATVLGGSGPDAVTVTRGDQPQVRVGGRLPVTATAAVEALAVDGLEGADLVVVDGVGGPASLALAGGAPATDGDVVRLIAPDATVTFDHPPTGGALDSPGGALSFSGVDGVDVVGDGSGVLTVRGTDGPDTVTLGDPGAPAVRVNGGAAVTYGGHPTLVLDGRGGSDTTTVDYTNTGDLGTIRAVGGSAQDDILRIVDALGTTRRWTVEPTDADRALITADGGAPAIAASGTGQVQLVGRGAGDHVRVATPGGVQEVVLTPGGAVDAGTARVGALLAVAFSDLGADSRLLVREAIGPAQDHVVLLGTEAADAVRVTGSDRTVHRTGWLPVVADSADLTIRGFGGIDVVTATGPLPWTTTTVEGGGPDDGDAVSLDGPSGDAVVDLAAGSITGFGGTVRLLEVDELTTDHAARGLRTLGTARDDAMCVTPLTPRDGRLHIIESPGGGLLTDSCQPAPGTIDLRHLFLDVGALVIDPGTGSDQVLVDGTVEDDAVIVESTGLEVAVTIHPNPADTATVRLPVRITTPTTENVIVATDNGVDDVDVRLYEAAAPVITIHGEAPSTRKADHMIVRDLSGGSNIGVTGSTLEPGAGTVVVEWRRFSGTQITVNYTGVEDVRTYKVQRPRAGGPSA